MKTFVPTSSQGGTHTISFYSELDNLSLSELIARFHGAPLGGEEYAYTTYSEVALFIRQQGKAGAEFLHPKGMIWNEAKKASLETASNLSESQPVSMIN